MRTSKTPWPMNCAAQQKTCMANATCTREQEQEVPQLRLLLHPCTNGKMLRVGLLRHCCLDPYMPQGTCRYPSLKNNLGSCELCSTAFCSQDRS